MRFGLNMGHSFQLRKGRVGGILFYIAGGILIRLWRWRPDPFKDEMVKWVEWSGWSWLLSLFGPTVIWPTIKKRFSDSLVLGSKIRIVWSAWGTPESVLSQHTLVIWKGWFKSQTWRKNDLDLHLTGENQAWVWWWTKNVGCHVSKQRMLRPSSHHPLQLPPSDPLPCTLRGFRMQKNKIGLHLRDHFDEFKLLHLPMQWKVRNLLLEMLDFL